MFRKVQKSISMLRRNKEDTKMIQMKFTMSKVKNIVDGIKSRLNIAEKKLMNSNTQQYKLSQMSHRKEKKINSITSYGTTSDGQIYM